MMKKLINDPELRAWPTRSRASRRPTRRLRVDHEHKVIYRADAPGDRARSGSFRGAVRATSRCTAASSASGMLDAACPGEVFTSPTPDQMLAATRLVDGGAGVIHIVKNYTGDVMNFEMAAELAAADDRRQGGGDRHERRRRRRRQPLHRRAPRGRRHRVGREDRAAPPPRQGQRPRRRSPPSAGRSTAGGRSMGMALTSCTVPAAGKPTFELVEDEMEIGIGIHGEPGRYRRAAGTAAEIAERLRRTDPAPICPSSPATRCMAFVNGMGGTPLIELYVMFGEVSRILAGHGITDRAARWSARTSPHSRWPAARSPCSSWTTS